MSNVELRGHIADLQRDWHRAGPDEKTAIRNALNLANAEYSGRRGQGRSPSGTARTPPRARPPLHCPRRPPRGLSGRQTPSAPSPSNRSPSASERPEKPSHRVWVPTSAHVPPVSAPRWSRATAWSIPARPYPPILRPSRPAPQRSAPSFEESAHERASDGAGLPAPASAPGTRDALPTWAVTTLDGLVAARVVSVADLDGVTSKELCEVARRFIRLSAPAEFRADLDAVRQGT